MIPIAYWRKVESAVRVDSERVRYELECGHSRTRDAIPRAEINAPGNRVPCSDCASADGVKVSEAQVIQLPGRVSRTRRKR